MTRSALLLAILALLPVAEAADAAAVDVVGRSNVTVRYVAGPGEQNDLTFAVIEDTTAYLVTDQGASISAGSGCVSVGVHRAVCITGSARLRATLLDGDDVLRPSGWDHVRANGGPGDDVLFGGNRDDHLDGGGGKDELHGGDGIDVLRDGDGSNADADILDGGAGQTGVAGSGVTDTVSYADRTEPLTINLAAPVPDGAAGEGDVFLGIEGVHSGHGDDQITGSAGNDYIQDDGGDNRISGLGGRDVFRVPSGRIDCGPGIDELRGTTPRAVLLPSCEFVLRAYQGEDFSVRAYPRTTSDGLQLPMECTDYDGEPIRCSGIVTITARSRVLASGTLRAGTGRRIAVLKPTPAGLRIVDRPVVATIAIEGRGLPDISWSVRLTALTKG